MERLQRLGHPPVQELAPRRQDLRQRHLADGVVREVEALPHAVQHAAANQLFQALGSFLLVEPGGPLEEGEVELAPDDGRGGHERPTPLAERLQAAREDHSHTLGQRAPRRHLGRPCLLGGLHALDRDEGIPLARQPDVRTELLQGALVAARSRERPHEGHGVGPRERPQGERHQILLAAQVLERAAEDGDVTHLLLARGHEHEGTQWLKPPREECQEPHRHLVGPVKVFQHQDKRPAGGEYPDELGDAFEELEVISTAAGRRGADLGEEPGQLGAPDGSQGLEHLRVARHVVTAERDDPRAEGEDLLGLVGAAEEHSGSPLGGVGHELGQEASLSDPGFANDRDAGASPGPGAVERCAELSLLGFAPDEPGHRARKLGRSVDAETLLRVGGRVLGRPDVGRQRCGPAAQHLLIELPSLCLGLHAELPLKYPDAVLVVPEGGAPSPPLGIQAHQRPVDGLLAWIE